MKMLIQPEVNYCVNSVLVKIVLLKENYNEKTLHEIRISLRKSISLINFFKDSIHSNDKQKIELTLKKLFTPTSKVRDYDVVLNNYIYPELLTNNDNNKHNNFIKHSNNKIAYLHKNTIKKLTSPEYRAMLINLKIWTNNYNWDDALEKYDNKSITKYIEKKINNEYTQLIEQKNNIFYLSRKKLHHYRIRAKELRYIIELFKFFIKDYQKILIELKEIQDLLGEINDTYMAHKIVKELNTPKLLAKKYKYIDKKISKHRKSCLHKLHYHIQ